MKNIKPRTEKYSNFYLKVFVLFLAATLSFQQIAFAARRNAGGGDLAEFSVGKWAAGTAIGLASFTIGSAVAGGLGSVLQGGQFAAGFAATSPLSIGTWAGNFNVMAATKQVGRAVGSMGSYYGWNPKTTIIASSIAQSVTGAALSPVNVTSAINETANQAVESSVDGAVQYAENNAVETSINMTTEEATEYVLNHSVEDVVSTFALQDRIGTVSSHLAANVGTAQPLVSPMLKNAGTAMGFAAIDGAVQGGVLAATADKDGNYEPWAGAVAGLAGGLASGMAGVPFNAKDANGNLLTTGQKIGNVLNSSVKSVPSHALSMGVGYINKKNKDPQNQYMIQQAFSGVYPVINAVMSPTDTVTMNYDADGNISVSPSKAYTDYEQFTRSRNTGSNIPGPLDLNINNQLPSTNTNISRQQNNSMRQNAPLKIK